MVLLARTLNQHLTRVLNWQNGPVQIITTAPGASAATLRRYQRLL
jgi:hypothetical protein